MNKKMIIAGLVAVAAVAGAWARPCGPHHFGGPRFGHHHGFVHHGGFHHGGYHHGGWGRGGCHFWPGFVGGVVGSVVGGAVYDAVVGPRTVVVGSPAVVAPSPVVVQQPVVVSQPVVTQPVVAAPVQQMQNVWVEGRYVDQVQANGSVVRVWQPGHYEQQSVYVQ